MIAITEESFDYSRDCLGESVKKFVEAMSAARADIEIRPGKMEGHFDFLCDQLCDIQDAYLDLFEHLLECGIQGRKIDLLKTWEIEDMKSRREVAE